MLICSILAATGQFLWKLNTNESFSLLLLMGGFVSYGIATIFLILGLRSAPLTIAYPMVSMGFVWALFLSSFLNDIVTITQVAGVILIILGVSFLGDSS